MTRCSPHVDLKKECRVTRVRLSLFTVVLLWGFSVHANEVDEAFEGFDDTPVSTIEENVTSAEEALLDGFDDAPMQSMGVEEKNRAFIPGLTGKFTQQIAYSLYDDAPHDNISSLKSSLFLDYEQKFDNGFKFKANAKAYYDAMYDIKGSGKFSPDELDALRSEVELFDAYIEGSITDSFDMKLGRQVVVWGRSDTIRVTDVLNPLDNRRPGMVDIEDLRLPVTMAKFDYFVEDWRVTPIAILEQRFSKNPPYGSIFYPAAFRAPNDEDYSDVTYALSIGGEFTGWDVNFYAARLHDDTGRMVTSPQPMKKHDKVTMFGTALNVLSGPWLFKTEFAYFNGVKYTTTADKDFTRSEWLLGFEYKGIADTLISYDIVYKNIGEYDARLLSEATPIEEESYQHAFRVSADFMHAKLTANYLLLLNGKTLDEGGFQRAWVKYELGEGINTNIGMVDYIGGSLGFDLVKDNDMFFADVSYSF